MPRIRNAIATAIIAATLAASAAHANESTDLWWDPQESGWGMNLVQQGEVAFVTLFVHGPDGHPTWYFASDARVFALGDDGRPAFRGTLYRARGPWLGGPFDPSKVAVEPVGTVVIEPRLEGRLFLEYVAEGVTVRKNLVRNSFAVPVFAASHLGAFSLRESVPGEPSWAVRRYAADVHVQVEGGEAFIRVQDDAGACHYRGPYQPSGRFATVSGRFECEGGGNGAFEISELEITKHGVSGYLRTWSAEANRHGRFAAARY